MGSLRFTSTIPPAGFARPLGRTTRPPAGVPARVIAWVSMALGLGGCGTQVEVAPTALSEEGESCESRQECAAGLTCIDLLCLPETAAVPADRPDASAAGPAPMSATRGGLGESCTRRADCAGGLLCLEQRCLGEPAPDAMTPIGPRKGTRGESCVVSNDCELGMGCFGNRCRERSLQLPRVARECHRVECVEVDDCCRGFVPEDPMLCAELDLGCQGGARADCNLYASLCECSRLCEDAVCVASVECESDLDCGGSGVLRCFAGVCAQCALDSDCSGNAACIGGLCRRGCERNEECPLLSECDGGSCQHVGCKSDRECYFFTDSLRSRCVDSECRTPCESDSACGVYQACHEGVCVFVGCESDDECQAALRLFDQSTTDVHRAVCRAPASG